MAALVLVLAGVTAVVAQRAPTYFGAPDFDDRVPDWLPGIWSSSVWVIADDHFLPARAYSAQYTLRLSEDGTLQAARWRELLPAVDVAFHDGGGIVLRERVGDETLETTLDLRSSGTEQSPSVTGVLRIERDGTAGPTYLRVTWRKLPDDFFDGAI